MGGLQHVSANEKLRRLLQGKGGGQRVGAGTRTGRASRGQKVGGQVPAVSSKYEAATATKRSVEDEEEEEVGRSAVGKSKRKGPAAERPRLLVKGRKVDPEVKLQPGARTKALRTVSYLDEMLETNARKREKKRRRKEGRNNGWSMT